MLSRWLETGFAGSRFLKGAESRYSPTEGEALAVAWALEHARAYTLGCNNLIVSTDHKPLMGILNDRELCSIKNPRISKIKEKTLLYTFKVYYNPGKWHRAPDALSRYPDPSCSPNNLFGGDQSCKYIDTTTNMAASVEETVNFLVNDKISILNIELDPVSEKFISLTDLGRLTSNDVSLQRLKTHIITGFPQSRQLMDADIRQFWEVRDRLSVSPDNIILMDDRLVIPCTYRKNILNALHAAHQGVEGMRARAQLTIYWPGLNNDIRNKRYNCQYCNEISCSQTRQPIILVEPPEYPYQRVCADYFEIKGHKYLAYVDRFSGWITIYHFGQRDATSSELIKQCRSLFSAYGVPEQFESDGGPQFSSHLFKAFLQDWGVKHRISSAEYAQSNGRAELAVKSAKRMIQNNVDSSGSLNNDKVLQALLQYRNTPVAGLSLSPAQILLHRNLRDKIPANRQHYTLHKSWIMNAKQRERFYLERNAKLADSYNKGTRELTPITPQSTVLIHCKEGNKKRWSKMGTVVEVLPFRQYRIKLLGSGRVILRNRRFIKVCCPVSEKIGPERSSYSLFPSSSFSNTKPTALVQCHNVPDNNHCEATDNQGTSREVAISSSPVVCINEQQPLPFRNLSDREEINPPITNSPILNKMPLALRRLQDYNKPGLRELHH